MKAAYVILCILGGNGLALPTPAQSAPAATPHLEVQPLAFDFGEVWQGTALKQDFTVRNAGTAPLEIKVHTSCGCTVATSPASPLAPGANSTFSVTYDSNTQGPADKKVTLKTNDPQHAELELPVKGTVKPIFNTLPSDRILFTPMETDAHKSSSLQLVNNYPEPVHLKLKDGQSFGRFKVRLVEVKPGQEYRLEADTNPPMDIGVNHAEVLVETGLPKSPVVKLFVTGRAEAAVYVLPARILVPPNVPGPIQQILRVHTRGADPVQVADLKCTLDRVHWQIQPLPPKAGADGTRVQEIILGVPAYDKIPTFGAKLEIFTDSPDEAYRKLEVIISRGPPRSTAPETAPANTPPPASP